MFRIRLDERALDEIAELPTFHRARLLDEIERQLTHEPAKATRRKKFIRGIVPPWADREGFWQLTVVPYRVFYDVDEERKIVEVRAVRRKLSRRTEDSL